jgi:hypothetical protein
MVAGLIIQRDWERLYIVLKGMAEDEDRVRVLIEAGEAVGSVRVAYALKDAIREIAHLTAEKD